MKKLLLMLCLILLVVLFSCNKAEEQVKVFFFSNGGSAIPTQRLVSGDVATQPEPPTMENGIFDGWYYGQTKWDFSNVVTGDTILVAKWRPAGTIVFDTGKYENLMWDGNYDTTRIVEFGNELGDLPEPTLPGYIFIGWYKDINDTSSRLQSSSVMPTQSDIVLYPLFEGDYSSHNWSVAYTDATCTEPAKKISTCLWHNEVIVDDEYSRMNPALCHKWKTNFNTGGWRYTTLNAKRECTREGCGYTEEKDLEDITSRATIKISCAPGTYPREDYWPNYLTDGKWSEAEGALACSPKGGGDLMITLRFDTPQDIDQIALSAVGFSDQGYSTSYEVYLLFEGDIEFGTKCYRTGDIFKANDTKETATIIDFTDIGPVLGVRIVRKNTLHGVELYYELAVGRFPDEE